MQQTDKPNLILIMTDQQRADTIRAHGYSHMHTPNLDRLAERAISFTRSFCSGVTCVASRSALFTGMYAHNTGVYSFNDWSHQRSWVHDLADAGYHCVNIGKMHVSPRDERLGFHERVIVENPTSRFAELGKSDDEWGRHLSLNKQNRPQDRHLTDPDWHAKHQGVPWHLDEHLHSDVFIGNSALAWIQRHRPKQPVFLQIGFTGPHEPYDPLPRHYELYKNRNVPSAVWKDGELDGKPPQHLAHQGLHYRIKHESTIDMAGASDDEMTAMRRHYYAKVTTIDEKIGEIMNALEENGYLQHAIVIFTSDHGDMLGDHRLPYKWLMYDSVVNVPLIVWDSSTQDGARVDDLVSLMDIGPTLLEAAGVPVPPYMEGKSLLGYTRGWPPEPERYVFCEDNYLTMVRSSRYKLVHYTGQEENGELYDLQYDPHELNNLFHRSEFVAVKQELKEALLRWILQSTYRTTGYKTKSMRGPRWWPIQPPYRLH
ncbi:MAG: Arylsulfatase [Paenibacillus sp.]|nr:Arylsulfatase [Paenibacillus sp.]